MTDRETVGTRGWGAIGGEVKVTPGDLCPESWECSDDLPAHHGSQDYPITGVTWGALKETAGQWHPLEEGAGNCSLPWDSDVLFCSIPVVSACGAGGGDVALPGDIW